MSLKVMNRLGLKVTRPYRNVCGINSRAILVCGLIKEPKFILATYLDIYLLMDVVVIDVPHSWGMLLYKKWVATLGGILQMDFSYATIITLEGDFFTLYREPFMGYQVEDPQKPASEIMYLDEMIGNFCAITNPITQEEEFQNTSDVWTLEFDGAHSSSRFSVGIVLIAPLHEATFFSYKIEFNCTNNIVEYEALTI